MGFDPNVAILFSGIGTLIFFVLVGGRVPSYLGLELRVHRRRHRRDRLRGQRTEREPRRGARRHHRRRPAVRRHRRRRHDRRLSVDRPPDAAGGHRQRRRGDRTQSRADRREGHLRQRARHVDRHRDDRRRRPRRRSRARARAPAARCCSAASPAICIYVVCTNGAGLGKPIDFAAVAAAPWIGMPRLQAPVWNASAMALIAPVAIVLVAENLGHIKAVAAMTGRNLDPWLGRAFIGDGLATIARGRGRRHRRDDVRGKHRRDGGDEDLLDAAVRRRRLLRDRARLLAEIRRADHDDSRRRCSGGLSIVVFGLITATGARIWVQNHVDFSRARNLVTAAVTLTIGAGDLALKSAASRSAASAPRRSARSSSTSCFRDGEPAANG